MLQAQVEAVLAATTEELSVERKVRACSEAALAEAHADAQEEEIKAVQLQAKNMLFASINQELRGKVRTWPVPGSRPTPVERVRART